MIINALAVCILKYLIVGSCLGRGTKIKRQHLGHKFVSVLQPCITHHIMKIVLKYRTLSKKAYTYALFVSQTDLDMLKEVCCQQLANFNFLFLFC